MERHEISIVEVSCSTYEVLGEVTLPTESGNSHSPTTLVRAFSEDGRFLYVVDSAPQPVASEGARVSEVHEIDTRAPSRIVRSVQLPGADLQSLAIHETSGRIFVSDTAGAAIWVIDRDYFAVQSRIRLDGRSPGALAISPSGDVLYVEDSDGRSLWLIDPFSNRIFGHLENLDSARTEAETVGDGSRLFVSHRTANGDMCLVREHPETPAQLKQRRVVWDLPAVATSRRPKHPPADRLVA